MSLEAELKTIWDRYETQRAAERNAVETREKARLDLHELNQRRIAAGLPVVSEHRDYGSVGIQPAYTFVAGPAPKTWRDEMDAEMLATIRRHFAGAV